MERNRMGDESNGKIKRKIRRLEERLAKMRAIIVDPADEELEYIDVPMNDIGTEITLPHSQNSTNVTDRSCQSDETSVTMENKLHGSRSPIQGTSIDDDHIFDSENESDRPLDYNILIILGDSSKSGTNFGKNIHKDVAARWQKILAKGLSEEVKESIKASYNIPANVDFLAAPVINPEVRAELTESLVKKDNSLLCKQDQIGIALAALAQATEMILRKELSPSKVLKPISDASRLLCDSHYLETQARRNLITNAINGSLKDTLIDTSRDRYLFGESLSDKLKTAQAIQKSGNASQNQFQGNSFIGTKKRRERLNSFSQFVANQASPRVSNSKRTQTP